MSHTTKLRLLEQIGGHFNDKLVQAVKSGRTLRGTGDNLDMSVRAHDVTSDHQNRDLHYFATSIIVNRLEFLDLPNNGPKRPLDHLNVGVFLLSQAEMSTLRSNFMVLVGRVLSEFLDCFRFLNAVVPKHIRHRYSEEMSQKSTIVAMPVLFHNEKEYGEVVKILRTYERWIAEIYRKAGLVNADIDEQDMVELLCLVEGQSSLPDQPQAHQTQDDPNDPLKDIHVPFEGDQLTRVRFAGARDLVAGNQTATQRFDHTTPYRSALWHTKASFLQVSLGILILGVPKSFLFAWM